MDQARHDFWQIPGRISPRFARWLLVLAAAMLPLALAGLALYEGWHRITYVTAFVLIGLGNALWALGSLVPDGPLSLIMRGAMRPVVLLMFVALAATLGFQFGIWG
jgi:hypothetical protein